MEDFLGAEVAFDDKALTEDLYRALIVVRRQVQTTVPVNRLTALDEAIHGLFAGRTVDLGEWLPTLPEPERNAIDAEVRRRHLDRAFEIDPETQARLLTSKARYRGDHGLRVQVDWGHRDMLRVSEIPGQTPRRFRVTIETSTWEPE